MNAPKPWRVVPLLALVLSLAGSASAASKFGLSFPKPTMTATPTSVFVTKPDGFDPTPELPQSLLGFVGQEYFHSLDVARAAREEWGPIATAVSVGDSIDDWRASVAGDLKRIDLQRAVDDQYGPEYSLVALGVHRDDWRAVRIPFDEWVVFPLLLVSSDRLHDIGGVDDALDNLRSVALRTQLFYNDRVGKTFRLIEPAVIPTQVSEAGWDMTSSIVPLVPEARYVMLDQAIAEFEDAGGPPAGTVVALLSPYTGSKPDVFEGAARRNKFAVVPQRSNSVLCPETGPLDANCRDATYAVAHELGHVFGLKHSCDAYPNDPGAPYSVMQRGEPPAAILLNPEIDILRNSRYFDIETGPAPTAVVPAGSGTCG